MSTAFFFPNFLLSMSCKHTTLRLVPSPFVELAGYDQANLATRLAAETKTGRIISSNIDRPTVTFPGLLVLPHDDLNYDPECSPQSFKSWKSMKMRNKMTDKTRDTLYVAEVPGFGKEMNFMRDWVTPKDDKSRASSKSAVASLDADLFVSYLNAFYHGMSVKLLPKQLSWTDWEQSLQPSRRVNLPKNIGLAFDDQCTCIRVRAPPDGTFAAQLNLDDIIDAAIEMLPADAYALVLLIDHDMYESENDGFCCGRAYGGSRVAVVQTAWYNPCLDAKEGVDRAHMWPMSHCKDFVDGLCTVEDVEPKSPSKLQIAMSKTACRATIGTAIRLSSIPND